MQPITTAGRTCSGPDYSSSPFTTLYGVLLAYTIGLSMTVVLYFYATETLQQVIFKN